MVINVSDVAGAWRVKRVFRDEQRAKVSFVLHCEIHLSDHRFPSSTSYKFSFRVFFSQGSQPDSNHTKLLYFLACSGFVFFVEKRPSHGDFVVFTSVEDEHCN
jgi:hypothetical protein